jgi:hypothetical protein
MEFLIWVYGCYGRSTGLPERVINPVARPQPADHNKIRDTAKETFRMGFEPTIPVFEQPEAFHVSKGARSLLRQIVIKECVMYF